ncbi:anthranilate synthase component II [Gloeobacter kilaueensis]|uniref:Anthranilate synthase component II n=1 Tax=Gloeobacter kilaueensis (strain ATCC BAA-2537 / CCAP 1431/1 / ULC 316 / JS1) TaxID=1183438 RepID=U5QK62_GLOK1|nr:aminodeoxychorismate/anthranilate synthase component II [Gloeobacter kilaueensis]AGY59342.1 anthranilate synthase component II [Gloeobacter kilaueensis JS1]
MILVIDNYDSFTYNLVQYLAELGAEVQVRRNDQINLDQVRELAPAAVVISPGPGRPEDAGISGAIVAELGSSLPVLGVCLGHQAIGQVFGGAIVRATELMHGKTSLIHHRGEGVFANLPQPFVATRYHSLVIDRERFPQVLEITAWTEDGTVMGVRHRAWPHIQGVQFHPESILTAAGKDLLRNFLESLANA